MSMEDILNLRELLAPHDLTFFADVPYVYHCHHYNLFHDQTVDDVLGEEQGFIVRRNAAQAAFGQLLVNVFEKVGASTAAEKAEIAQALFAAAGHGKLTLPGGTSGSAFGTHLHYGYAWKEKYGELIRRFEPADAFAAGAASAAVALANGLPLDALETVETACLATRAPRCEFEVSNKKVELPPVIDRAGYARHLGEGMSGQHEEEIAGIAAGLQGFLRGVAGDDRGLVQAFGIYATMHFTNYYNETAYAALHFAQKERPGAVKWVEALLREAGHVCVFHTFGGILQSPEWEGLAGRFTGDPLEVVKGCASIARGLGFGHWCVTEFEENERLVVRTTSNYESPWYQERFGKAESVRSYFFEGAVLAWAVLAHRVSWADNPTLDTTFYRELFQGGGSAKLGWKIETTRCMNNGDAYTEVVVTPN